MAGGLRPIGTESIGNYQTGETTREEAETAIIEWFNHLEEV
jgi:hypothetical protein